MDSKRKIDVGISSGLIDLKAELLKKSAELKSTRAHKGVPKTVGKAAILNAKSPYVTKNKGIEARSQKDLEEKREEEKTVAKAKTILEQKAKLYERMTSEALEHDELEHPVLSRALVNFTQKAIDKIKDDAEGNGNKRQEPQPIFDEPEPEEEDIGPAFPVNEEEWVEFVDGLGRTRRCLKTDLPSFLSRDDELARPRNPGVSLSREAEQRLIEMKRKKWEKESQETADKDNIHYQDVLYDEIRSHGVGFYGFSKDETERAEQLKELKRLSEETSKTREKVLKERSAKDAALQEKLKKIRAKKRAKLGLPPLEEKETDVDDVPKAETSSADNETKTEIPSTATATSSSRIETDEDDDNQPKKMRAWDFGKPGVFGSKPDTFDELDAKWLKDRRADRISEFAPPSAYK